MAAHLILSIAPLYQPLPAMCLRTGRYILLTRMDLCLIQVPKSVPIIWSSPRRNRILINSVIPKILSVVFQAARNTAQNAHIDIYGNISVADRGFLAIIAPQIINNPIANITANLGKVLLAGGEVVNVVNFDSKALINFEFSDSDFVNASKLNSTDFAMIDNYGTISAMGGTVQLSAHVAKSLMNDVLKTVIANESSGKIQVGIDSNKVGNKGQIVIQTENGSFQNNGTISAKSDQIGYGNLNVTALNGGEILLYFTGRVKVQNLLLNTKGVSEYKFGKNDIFTAGNITSSGVINATNISMTAESGGRIDIIGALTATKAVTLKTKGTVQAKITNVSDIITAGNITTAAITGESISMTTESGGNIYSSGILTATGMVKLQTLDPTAQKATYPRAIIINNAISTTVYNQGGTIKTSDINAGSINIDSGILAAPKTLALRTSYRSGVSNLSNINAGGDIDTQNLKATTGGISLTSQSGSISTYGMNATTGGISLTTQSGSISTQGMNATANAAATNAATSGTPAQNPVVNGEIRITTKSGNITLDGDVFVRDLKVKSQTGMILNRASINPSGPSTDTTATLPTSSIVNINSGTGVVKIYGDVSNVDKVTVNSGGNLRIGTSRDEIDNKAYNSIIGVTTSFNVVLTSNSAFTLAATSSITVPTLAVKTAAGAITNFGRINVDRVDLTTDSGAILLGNKDSSINEIDPGVSQLEFTATSNSGDVTLGVAPTGAGQRGANIFSKDSGSNPLSIIVKTGGKLYLNQDLTVTNYVGTTTVPTISLKAKTIENSYLISAATTATKSTPAKAAVYGWYSLGAKYGTISYIENTASANHKSIIVNGSLFSNDAKNLTIASDIAIHVTENFGNENTNSISLTSTNNTVTLGKPAIAGAFNTKGVAAVTATLTATNSVTINSAKSLTLNKGSDITSGTISLTSTKGRITLDQANLVQNTEDGSIYVNAQSKAQSTKLNPNYGVNLILNAANITRYNSLSKKIKIGPDITTTLIAP